VKRHHLVLGLVSALTLTVGGAVPGAAADRSHAGIEHFLVVQTSDAGSPPVIGNGPIHAAGKDVQLSDTIDRFVFPKGALRVRHHAKSSHESFDPKTCLGTFSERGVYRIAAGTGAYSHVTGHGRYKVQGYFIGCSENDPSTVLSVIIRAHGPLSY
jgi:hypothetical protein